MICRRAGSGVWSLARWFAIVRLVDFSRVQTLDVDTLLNAYAQGAFPMADEDGVIRWYTADPRGVLPLADFHAPRSLRQRWRRGDFEIRINHGFRAVMTACRQTRANHTWINTQLVEVYCELHDMGFAHSVETWIEGKLAGGLYGVSLGAAFFGESMFHYVTDASKLALMALVDRLRDRRFELLDTQAVTQHLRRFGCTEMPSGAYLDLLQDALGKERKFG
jgi:leucyl/phenylalanyl-tRNA---protein transferase